MATQLKLRRGSSVDTSYFTGAQAEITVDTDLNTIVVHDGVTAGGTYLARSIDNQNTLSVAQAAFDQANTLAGGTADDGWARGQSNGAFAQANSSYTKANSAYNLAANSVQRTGDTMTGRLNLPEIYVSGNAECNEIIVNTTLYSGLATRSATPLPNVIAQFTSNSASYVQVNAQNINPNGSGDFVVTADNGHDDEFYIDMGYLGSEYNPNNPLNSLGTCASPLDGYLYVQGSKINQLGGNLIIGTTSSQAPTQIKVIAGGVNSENVVATFDSTLKTTLKGDLQVNGSFNLGHSLVTNGITNSAIGAQNFDVMDNTKYRTGKYVVQVSQNSNYHTIELLVITNGSVSYLTQYSEIYTSAQLGVFSASRSGSQTNVRFTPFDSDSNYTLVWNATYLVV